MKTYRDQMHGLQFTPEQKAAMVDALLAASQAPHQRRPQPRKALLIAAVAAAVALAGAAASVEAVLAAAPVGAAVPVVAGNKETYSWISTGTFLSIWEWVFGQIKMTAQ